MDIAALGLLRVSRTSRGIDPYYEVKGEKFIQITAFNNVTVLGTCQSLMPGVRPRKKQEKSRLKLSVY